jgi:hypothetical protein
MARGKDPIGALQRLEKRLLGLGDEYMRSDRAKERAEEMAETIRRRTQLGRGVKGGENGGELEQLDGLSDSYKAKRKRYRANLSEFTTVGRSNLTATGQLMKALRARVIGLVFVLYINDARPKGTLTGRKSKVGNNAIAAYVRELGRPFFALSRTEMQGYHRKIRQDLLGLLRKANTRA